MATMQLSGASATPAPSARVTFLSSLSGHLALAFTIFDLLPALVIAATLNLHTGAFQRAFAAKAA